MPVAFKKAEPVGGSWRPSVELLSALLLFVASPKVAACSRGEMIRASMVAAKRDTARKKSHDMLMLELLR